MTTPDTPVPVPRGILIFAADVLRRLVEDIDTPDLLSRAGNARAMLIEACPRDMFDDSAELIEDAANRVVRAEPPMTYIVVKDGVMHTQPVPCYQVPSIGEIIDYCGPCKVWDVCWSEGCAVLSASTPPGFGPDGDDL